MKVPKISQVRFGDFIFGVGSVEFCPEYLVHHFAYLYLAWAHLAGCWQVERSLNLPKISQVASAMKVPRTSQVAFRQLIFRWGGSWKCPGFFYCNFVVINLAQALF